LSTTTREKLFLGLIQDVRRFIANAVLFNQHLADKLGLNATDYQVLNLLDLHGSAKPGELSRLTGMTTGGVTMALDRLEKAGFVRRERNPNDRRSVIVRPVPAKMRKVFELYRPINAGMEQLMSSYGLEELATVAEFFSRCNAARASVDEMLKR